MIIRAKQRWREVLVAWTEFGVNPDSHTMGEGNIVLCLQFDDRLQIAYIESEWSYPVPVQLPYYDILDGRLPTHWSLGVFQQRHALSPTVVIGPPFWSSDIVWYQRLVDSDKDAQQQYDEYVKHIKRSQL